MKGHVPKEELERWFKTWSRKIFPRRFYLLGGEPLLHPELAEIPGIAKRYWSDSEIVLVTNGLLFPEIGPEIFESIRKNEILVSVSQHLDTPHYSEKVGQIRNLLQEEKCRCEIRPSHKWWLKSYRLEKDGAILPYRSDPKAAWDICFVKNECVTLMDDRIYKCPQLACFGKAYKNGILSREWSELESYEPLEPSCDLSDMEKFFRTEQVPSCRICPETFLYAGPEEKLHDIR